MSNTTGVTSGAGTAYPSGAPELSIFLRFTDSDYPFGIFKLFLYNLLIKLTSCTCHEHSQISALQGVLSTIQLIKPQT